MVERRQYRRHRVGGNVEITSVLGAGRVPDERATIVDCSLGGARLRVPSPRRRLFKALPPCLAPRDSITCVLRLAPHYEPIEVFAEVVRAARLPDDADVLEVGLRFFHDGRSSNGRKPMARLARIIEPDWSAQQEALAVAAAEADKTSRRLPAANATPTPVERPAAQSARLPKVGRTTSARLPKVERTASERLPKLERTTSARLPRVDRTASERLPKLERTTSERLPKLERTTSERLPKLERTASARLPKVERATSERLPEVEETTGARPASPAAEQPAREERTSRRAARVSARHERRTSARLDRPSRSETVDRASARVDAREEEVAEARVSGRLLGARLDPDQVPARRAPSSDSEVVAWASSRLAAPAPAPERVTTADEEVTVRGSARLVEGKAVIELPGAFTALAREAGLTAHVTPTADCAGLFVAERSPARLVVRELGGGRSDATFDYLVIATRRA